MSKQSTKRVVIPVDFKQEEKEALQFSARRHGLGLAPFIKFLLFSHPLVKAGVVQFAALIDVPPQKSKKRPKSRVATKKPTRP